MRKINEECGVFGLYDNNNFEVAKMVYCGLFALQHRGQQGAGIALNDYERDGNIFNHHKDVGLVSEVFGEKDIRKLKGSIGLGHVRYCTLKASARENVQPLISRHHKGCLAIAHNGNLVNAKSIREELELEGALFQSSNDSEVIMHLIARARNSSPSIEEAMLKVMERIKGAYSLLIMSPKKLIGVRDPQGFRPLCLGKIEDSYILCSETCGLDVVGAEYVRDIEPGEMVVISSEGIKSIKKFCGSKPALCVFEYVYFARPDSIIDDVSVYQARVETGKALAKAHPADADIVIGVPDSGLNFAVGYAIGSNIPYGEGLIKNRYTGRTFIKPTQEERSTAVSIKLNVLRSTVEGKRVIMVDDSIVRGTTSANLIRMLKNAGATEVHMRVASPPFLWPCYFGTDISSRSDLAAVTYTLEDLRQKIGADSLGFLPIEAFDKIGLRKDFGYCKACFTGEYPIDVKEKEQEFYNRK